MSTLDAPGIDSSDILHVPRAPMVPRPQLPRGSGWVTILLVAAGAITTGVVVAGTPWSHAVSGDPLSQLDAGGADGSLLRDGDWWRLFQPLFVPRHALHAAMVFFSVGLIGMQIEGWLSGIRLLALVLIPATIGIAASYLTLPATPGQAGCLAGAVSGVAVALGATQLRGLDRRRLRMSLIMVFVAHISIAANDGSIARGWAGPVVAFIAAIALVPVAVPWDLRPGPSRDAVLVGLGLASLAALTATWAGTLAYAGPRDEWRVEARDNAEGFAGCQARIHGYWIAARSDSDAPAGMRHPGVPGSQLILLLPARPAAPDSEAIGKRISQWLADTGSPSELQQDWIAAPPGLADNAGIMRFRVTRNGDGPGPRVRVVDLVLTWDYRAQAYAEALVLWPSDLADHPQHLKLLAELSQSLALIRSSF
jgi:membrane associated rhomboid family serine protease